MKITLSESEIRIATWLAKMRTDSNREAKVYDHKIGPQDGEYTDLEGMLGEMAFCKLFNVYPDLSIKPQGHSYDCNIGGLRIDVKTTRHHNGKLLASTTKSVHDCDYYVLMVGAGGTYELIGYANSKSLIDEKNVIDLGHGPTYGLEQQALRDCRLAPWYRNV